MPPDAPVMTTRFPCTGRASPAVAAPRRLELHAALGAEGLGAADPRGRALRGCDLHELVAGHEVAGREHARDRRLAVLADADAPHVGELAPEVVGQRVPR